MLSHNRYADLAGPDVIARAKPATTGQRQHHALDNKNTVEANCAIIGPVHLQPGCTHVIYGLSQLQHKITTLKAEQTVQGDVYLKLLSPESTATDTSVKLFSHQQTATTTRCTHKNTSDIRPEHTRSSHGTFNL